jgi:hypothetical protein
VEQLRTFQCGAIVNVSNAQPGEHVGIALRCTDDDDEGGGKAHELAVLESAELLIDPARLDQYVCAKAVVASFSIGQLPAMYPIVAPGLHCQFVGWTSTYDCTIEVRARSLPLLSLYCSGGE